jgi:twitching motility protein PilT
MQSGQLKHGMQTFNQSLATLYHRRLISLQTALSYSSHQDELQDMINRGVGAISTTPEAQAATRRT